MIEITEKLLRLNSVSGRVHGNRPGVKMIPRKIIIHRTGNVGASALQNRDYFDTEAISSVYASAHYCVDSKTILKCVPDNELAYHCVGQNATSIGIELCEPLSRDAYTNFLDLIVYLLHKYKWEPDHASVQPHSKYDPIRRPRDPFSWDAYIKGKPATKQDLFDPVVFYKDLEDIFTKTGGTL